MLGVTTILVLLLNKTRGNDVDMRDCFLFKRENVKVASLELI